MVVRKTRGIEIKTAAIAATLGLVALTAAGGANAGCNFTLPGKSASQPASSTGVAHLTPALYQTADASPEVSSDFFGPSIVGLWKIEFVAKGNKAIPDGVLIDFGTAIWHEDGTEVMISGGREPATGDVCMGAWEQTGWGTFKLNHIAMAYAPDKTGKISYLGPAAVIENIVLDPSGNTFRGHFTITQYAAAPVPGEPFSEFSENPSTIQPPTPINGTITGKRLSAK